MARPVASKGLFDECAESGDDGVRAVVHASFSDQTEFRQFQQDDRIFDRSWNAVTRRPLKGLAELEKTAATNPYETAHDRAHRDESFIRAPK